MQVDAVSFFVLIGTIALVCGLASQPRGLIAATLCTALVLVVVAF
ncbi:MAG: hypothetical protein WBB50_11960 [Methyloceanibacter sp.]